MRNKYYWGPVLVLLVIASLVSQGCRHNNNPNNLPAINQAMTLDDAANTVNLVADGLVAANDIVNKLETTEPDYYAKAKPVLNRIANANLAAINTIRLAQQGNTAANWRQAMLNVSIALGSQDPTAFGFKNPSTQALVKAGWATLITALQLAGGAR